MHPTTTNANGLRMLKASGVVCGFSSFGVSSDCLQISGYNPIIRLEGHQRRGGGVALFETDSFVAKHRSDLELAVVEFLWVEFRIKDLDILCGVCYRPPDNDSVSLVNFVSTLNWFLIKFINLSFPNSTASLCWVTLVLISTLQTIREYLVLFSYFD